MNGFRSGKYDVLVATDIAARGIDVEDVSHVINFDVPGTPDDYTHRVGRTGRSERSGTAYTFAAVDELPAVHAIERKLKSKIPRRDAPELSLATGVTHEPRERIAKVESSAPDPMNRSRRRRRRSGRRRSPRKHNETAT